MTATAALAGGVILKKFYIVTALRAFNLKNCPFLPVLGILSGTFHGSFLSIFDDTAIGNNILIMSDRLAQAFS
jgi:hypothetical protein